MESHIDYLKHIVFADEIPENFSYNFFPGVFHNPVHLNLQGNGLLKYFILHKKKKKIIGHLFFHVANNEALSPLRATYGGIEIIDNLNLQVIYDFIEYYEEKLILSNIKKIRMNLAPSFYSNNKHIRVQNALLVKNYQIERAEIATAIPVTTNDFEDILSIYNKRLLKASKEDFIFVKEKVSSLEQVYDFILNARRKKGYALSMTFSELEKTVTALPKHFLLFTLRHQGRIIAASIAIMIFPDILYTFYSAHHSEYDAYSPIVLLLKNIYTYSRNNQIRMIDLGTSSIGKHPNFPLFHFKANLGSILSHKFYLEKNIK